MYKNNVKGIIYIRVDLIAWLLMRSKKRMTDKYWRFSSSDIRRDMISLRRLDSREFILQQMQSPDFPLLNIFALSHFYDAMYNAIKT